MHPQLHGEVAILHTPVCRGGHGSKRVGEVHKEGVRGVIERFWACGLRARGGGRSAPWSVPIQLPQGARGVSDSVIGHVDLSHEVHRRGVPCRHGVPGLIYHRGPRPPAPNVVV